MSNYFARTAPWRFLALDASTITAALDSGPEEFRRQVIRRRRQDVRDQLRAKAREFRRQALRDHVARARAAS